MAVGSTEIALGARAADFRLPATDGRVYALHDVAGEKGAVIVFICNHCPYVKAVIGRLAADARLLMGEGVGFAAVCSNDAESYPEDSFANMREFARRHNSHWHALRALAHPAPQVASGNAPSHVLAAAHQLFRMLGFGSYRTAWFMAHRIREGMRSGNMAHYGWQRPHRRNRRNIHWPKGWRPESQSGPLAHERGPSLVERGGSARSFHVENVTKEDVFANRPRQH